ncbi:MAG: hypothetical protein HY960_15295 [Ignavibacteriae bacterium]|nr:hypothetical protein [Ignavibacteriota bacterium]
MKLLSLLAIILAVLLLPLSLYSHCDTKNGPVVTAAQKALETGNVNYVLVWVQKDAEAEIKQAFEKVLAIRKQSPEAKEFADNYFFETVVRIHRMGEGVGYTGIKSEGTQVEPGIEAADEAIEKGNDKELIEHLTQALSKGVKKHFEELQHQKNYAVDKVNAGREYVKAYVEFIHYVERLHQSITTPLESHGEPTQEHKH